jgi:putative membrane protein
VSSFPVALTAVALALAACGSTNETETADTNAAATDAAVDNAASGTSMAANPASGATEPSAAATGDAAMGTGGAMMSGEEFATQAAAGDMFEIESSQLALQKSQNADLKAFAQMIVADHTKATANLKSAAAKAQPAITVTPTMTPEQRQNMQALNSSSEAGFDRLYLTQQVSAHEKALEMLQTYAANGDVPALKQHASTTAPAVQKHLERARELSNAM